jgi:hypothetical protein
MTTNITDDHQRAFRALTSGEHGNFALFSCFLNGEPASTIVAVVPAGESFDIVPLFVSVTPSMDLTDHDGRTPSEPNGGAP